VGQGSLVVTEEEMVNALYKSKVDGKLPTLIFEIERGSESEQTSCINNVRSLCKEFAVCDNCIIILSETNGVLVFGNDPTSEKIILVPEMSQGEALNFIRSRNKSTDVNEKDLMRLFDYVGTNPADLEEFNNEGICVDEYISTKLQKANSKLMSLPFVLQPILKALKENPGEGISPSYFRNQKHEAIDLTDPVAVGTLMKAARTDVLFYDIESNVYRLNSNALMVALRTYKPVVLEPN
jgi:hypothetical protein